MVEIITIIVLTITSAELVVRQVCAHLNERERVRGRVRGRGPATRAADDSKTHRCRKNSHRAYEGEALGGCGHPPGGRGNVDLSPYPLPFRGQLRRVVWVHNHNPPTHP